MFPWINIRTGRLGLLVLLAMNAGVAAAGEASESMPGEGSSLRLLSRQEYDFTVADLLNLSPPPALAMHGWPGEIAMRGFVNPVGAHGADDLRVAGASRTAAEAARLVDSARLFACPSHRPERACRDAFIDRFLLRAFRRNVESATVAHYRRVFDRARRRGGRDAAVRAVVETALQSPRLLYRREAVNIGDAYDLATRLSYLLWASPPDDQLIEAAERGRLHTEGDLRGEIRRLKADPRHVRAIKFFTHQWLNLSVLDAAHKDRRDHPDYHDDLRTQWREDVLDHVDAAMRSPDVTLFDLVAGSAKAPVGDGPRAGLLTHPALMAMLAGPRVPSPVRRGAFVRERLLCEDLPPPPPDMVINAPEIRKDASNRERFEDHATRLACSACHDRIDPIGFAFEHYDSLGRWRADDRGHAIDVQVVLEDDDDPLRGKHKDVASLARALGTSNEVARCLVSQLLTLATGRDARAAPARVDRVYTQWRRRGLGLATLWELVALEHVLPQKAAPATTAARSGL